VTRKPTATEVALYPAPPLKKCSCGVLFAPRQRVGKEDPKKCLTCNRKDWSILHGFEAPGKKQEPGAAVAQIDRKRSRNA
jgi:hypothetical protein